MQNIERSAPNHAWIANTANINGKKVKKAMNAVNTTADVSAAKGSRASTVTASAVESDSGVAVRTDISAGVARARAMPSEQEESALNSSLWQRPGTEACNLQCIRLGHGRSSRWQCATYLAHTDTAAVLIRCPSFLLRTALA